MNHTPDLLNHPALRPYKDSICATARPCAEITLLPAERLRTCSEFGREGRKREIGMDCKAQTALWPGEDLQRRRPPEFALSAPTDRL